MSYIVVDVEADGPAPGLYSMICFGAVVVDDKLDKTFYGTTRPISDDYIPEALQVSGFTREEHLKFEDPNVTMNTFNNWIKKNSKGNPVFISDNNGFDWSFINYYFHEYVGSNPFGWSSRRIGDLWCGFQNDTRKRWKHLRKTKHTHNPVDDARGNAEALLAMRDMGLKIKFK